MICTRSRRYGGWTRCWSTTSWSFDDLVERESFDLWVGDEAWDVDHFLHENPELKRAPFVWMTDFVGWLPMLDGGEREAMLTADWNAEMVEHVGPLPDAARSVGVRGRPRRHRRPAAGAGAAEHPDWTEQHFDFAGYVMGDRVDAPGSGGAAFTVSGTRPTRSSAWSASAAPGSAGTCCGGWSAYPGGTSARFPACGWWR